jgi:P-type E1-E2 ATPase
VDISIPGRGRVAFRHVIFDMNGTLTLDGVLLPSIWPLFQTVREHYHCLVLTADTFGTAETVRRELGCEVRTVRRGEDKKDVVQTLVGGVAAVGNGRNDMLMFEAADLAIAVLGPEGLSSEALARADLIVPSIDAALGLLLSEQRLSATLRH